MDKTLILYDGVCVLCMRSVKFISKRDSGNRFIFANLDSVDSGDWNMNNKGEWKSIIVIADGRIFLYSDAIIRIVREFGYPWKLISILKWVPKFIRDAGYRFIAKIRYRVFGQLDKCWIPPENEKEKFITDEELKTILEKIKYENITDN